MMSIEEKIYGPHELEVEACLAAEKLTRFYCVNYKSSIYKRIISRTEISMIKAVLDHTKFNQSEASRILGISRGSLRKKMKEYGL